MGTCYKQNITEINQKITNPRWFRKYNADAYLPFGGNATSVVNQKKEVTLAIFQQNAIIVNPYLVYPVFLNAVTSAKALWVVWKDNYDIILCQAKTRAREYTSKLYTDILLRQESQL